MGEVGPEAGQRLSELSRRYMVETQIRRRGITDAAVLQAMERVPREFFVAASYREYAFSDGPLPIDSGQTISQPYMVAFMTEQLQLTPQMRVLEVGTGCGYQSAVLAEMGSQIYTIETVASLSDSARKRLVALGYPNIHFRVGDGHLGWPEMAPFDAIIVTAAPETVPQALLEQLKPGGRMMIPVGMAHSVQQLRLITKDHAGKCHGRDAMPVRFVPLVKDGN